MENSNPTPEQQAREQIDRKLTQAGWTIQDKQHLNLYESLGVAVREMDTGTGPADYMLFIDGKACGIIEAKREGADLGGVAVQSQRYATSELKYIQCTAANDEVRFRDERDPIHVRGSCVTFTDPKYSKTGWKTTILCNYSNMGKYEAEKGIKSLSTELQKRICESAFIIRSPMLRESELEFFAGI